MEQKPQINCMEQYWKALPFEPELGHFLEQGCLTERKLLCPALIYIPQTWVITRRAVCRSYVRARGCLAPQCQNVVSNRASDMETKL